MKVMVFGSFDKLHLGHQALFAQAKKHGDVYVVVARDDTIRRLKNREPRQSEADRVRVIAAELDVHTAVLGHPSDYFSVIEEYRPDVLLLGYDQDTFSEEDIAAELAARGLSAKILRGKPYKEDVYKSSKLTR